MSLTTQTPNFFITIRKNKVFDKELFNNFLAKNEGVQIYAYIEHKKDISKETGQIEGCHYHIVLVRKKTRISTMYNIIRDAFDLDNVNGVKVECAKSLEGSIQYLIHRNDPLKTQHKPCEIVTNLAKEELFNYLETEDNSITFQKVYNLCTQYDDIIYVIQAIGFTRYNLYRNTIRDIWNSCEKIKLSKRLKFEDKRVTSVNQS